MKTKHILTGFAGLGALAVVLRLLQFFLITDSEGYFVNSGILSWSVYAVIGIGAIFAAVVNIITKKEQADFNAAADTKSIGVLFIVSALLIMISNGIMLSGASFKIYLPINQAQIPNILNIATALLGILGAIYFALLGISLCSDKPSRCPSVMGIFGSLYFALLGINEFYMSFDRAGQSQTKLYMVSVCAIALFTVSLSLAYCKAEVFRGRVLATAGLTLLSTALTGIPTIISMLLGSAEFSALYIVHALLHTVFAVIACTVLIRLGYEKPLYEGDPQPIEFSPLDKYLNEIPDEDRGNDE